MKLFKSGQHIITLLVIKAGKKIVHKKKWEITSGRYPEYYLTADIFLGKLLSAKKQKIKIKKNIHITSEFVYFQ